MAIDKGTTESENVSCPPVTVSSNRNHWSPPFPQSPLQQADFDGIDPDVISEAISTGNLPELSSTIRATAQKTVLRDISRWYLAGRKSGLTRRRSRAEAETRAVTEHEIEHENVYVYYQRLDHPEEASPTSWFAEQLESCWQWYEKSYEPDEMASFRKNCRRLRDTLANLQGLATPGISNDEFTVGDFIEAGEEEKLNYPGVDIQWDNSAPEERIVVLQDRCSIKPNDITKFSIPFANTWDAVLNVIANHLVRYSKVDDAICLANGGDCTEAYAHGPIQTEGPLHDTTLEALYYGNGQLRLSCKITPLSGGDEDGVRFRATGTDYSDRAVETFIAEGIRIAERHEI